MLKIGVMVGRENTFPEAFIAEVNSRTAKTGVVAEYVKLGGSIAGEEPEWRVIVDRISHEVPYYQTAVKHAALHGTYVVNNPFWKLCDDKFFGTALAQKAGVPVPRTVALPNKAYIEDIDSRSLRNLEFPIPWEKIAGYTGLPAFIKPHFGGGWKNVSKVRTLEELISAYDRSGQLCMIVQQEIRWQAYVRCICIGREHIFPHPWDPSLPHADRYKKARFDIPEELMARMVAMAKTLNEALGYDMNTVEFAIEDGVPYAIDFMNAAPDFDAASLTDEAFRWVVNTMADFCIRQATRKTRTKMPLNPKWEKFLFA